MNKEFMKLIKKIMAKNPKAKTDSVRDSNGKAQLIINEVLLKEILKFYNK